MLREESRLQEGGAGISSAVKGVQEGMGWDVLASCGTWGPCLGLAALPGPRTECAAHLSSGAVSFASNL